MTRFMGLLAALFLTATPAHAQDAATAAALRDRALADPTAWRLLESLTTEVGPRPVGTPAMERARDWAVANLTALGFANVKVEEFAKPAWIRGPEQAAMTAPYPMKLQVLGLGRSPATPPGGVEAEVVVFDTYAELLARQPGALAGKIVLVNQPMARTQDGSGYSAIIAMRTQGPAEAARRGAAAYLVRSLATSNTALPHAGATTFPEGGPKIPAAALAVPDADHLARLAARGPVRVRLDLRPVLDPGAVAWNISGELPGSERPDEVVLIGAHLDSWDVSPGAHDDAAGIAITAAAARLIGRLPRYPRRTIRVVMFGSEETGGSSAAYAEAHANDNIVAASESDFGGGRIWAVRLPEGAHDHRAAEMAAAALAPLGVFIDSAPATYGGADLAGLKAAGVPVFQLRPDGRDYFDLHHSADDTLDKVDREDLNQAVAAWTTLVYLLADSDLDVRPPRPEPEPEPEPAAAPEPEAPLAAAPPDAEEPEPEPEPELDTLERLSRELGAAPAQAEDPDE